MIKITYHGSEQNIVKAVAVLNKHKRLPRRSERKARLIVQQLIDEHDLKAGILINGSLVWSKKRIMRNLEKLMKLGTLYNPDQKKAPYLSQYFYQFIHNCCGSIAHYDIHGWIHLYPTTEHLRKFFKQNEFGERVINWVNHKNTRKITDVLEIVKAIEGKLFPFQTYMESKQP